MTMYKVSNYRPTGLWVTMTLIGTLASMSCKSMSTRPSAHVEQASTTKDVGFAPRTVVYQEADGTVLTKECTGGAKLDRTCDGTVVTRFAARDFFALVEKSSQTDGYNIAEGGLRKARDTRDRSQRDSSDMSLSTAERDAASKRLASILSLLPKLERIQIISDNLGTGQHLTVENYRDEFTWFTSGKLTKSGRVFVREQRYPALGEAWRDESGMVWGDLARNESGKPLEFDARQAKAYCQKLGADLPTAEDFSRLRRYLGATIDQYRNVVGYVLEIIPNMLQNVGGKVVGNLYWSGDAYPPDGYHSFNGQTGEIGLTDWRVVDEAVTRCVMEAVERQ